MDYKTNYWNIVYLSAAEVNFFVVREYRKNPHPKSSALPSFGSQNSKQSIRAMMSFRKKKKIFILNVLHFYR